MIENHKSNFCKGLKGGIPIALGYFAVSFTLGIQAKNVGITAFQAAVTSFGLHASAGEYIAFTLIGANANILVMVLMEMIANARYLLMSCSLSQKIPADTPMWKRLVMGYFITDEIFAVATKEDEIKRSYFAGLATLPYLGWAFGTFIGTILGNILPDRLMSALSVAIYGMFVAVVVPEMKKARPVLIVVVIAVILSCIFYYIPLLSKISSGITITIVAITAAIIGSIFFPVSDETDNIND